MQTDNLTRLCTLILEPLRAYFGKPVRVSSGFRADKVNAAVKGSKTSDHKEGLAGDITINGVTPLEICKAAVELGLPFNQVINEFNEWCHISVCEEGTEPKREKLTATKANGKTVYTKGLM